MRHLYFCAAALWLAACGENIIPTVHSTPDASMADASGPSGDAGSADAAVSGGDASAGSGGEADAGATPARKASPHAGRVAGYKPGEGAGFGQDKMPDIVLGPPQGAGPEAGSLHVLSLGKNGHIVLEFVDMVMVDGPGPDLLVFENAFPAYQETGVVAVSDDGRNWSEWPCAATDKENRFPGCAGVNPVLSSPDNGVPANDPRQSGGDAFDLAELGVKRARFVRIRDSGYNSYEGISGGFDLDAVAIINGEPVK
ncbi:MAG: hypothetical protein GMKNLPBB_00729 [Myxococcota bacterium]|nr:hypothetical protein [Myxococcota bacterium]